MNATFSKAFRGACLITLFSTNVLEASQCSGPSMLPTFYTNDYVLVSHLHTVKNEGIARGDVIMALCPNNPSIFISKRIIALEGDIICVDPSLPSERREYLKIPKNHAWLQGDNIRNSTDSRTYGPVSLGLIKGKVIARLFPRPKFVHNGFEDALKNST